MNPAPSDESTEDVTEQPRRRPIEIFTRRGFLSRDTGRWHVLPRGRGSR
jgi:hypothetical protein